MSVPVPEYRIDEDSRRWQNRQEHIRVWNKLAMKTVRFSATAFLAFIILMWKTLFVYFLFSETSAWKPPVNTVHPGKIAVLCSITAEDMLRKISKRGCSIGQYFRFAQWCLSNPSIPFRSAQEADQLDFMLAHKRLYAAHPRQNRSLSIRRRCECLFAQSNVTEFSI